VGTGPAWSTRLSRTSLQVRKGGRPGVVGSRASSSSRSHLVHLAWHHQQLTQHLTQLDVTEAAAEAIQCA
jgi:hypothetical protein